MGKTEMLQQSAQSANATRVQALAHQIQAVRQARLHSVEDLAAVLEPLTQALATLSEQTRTSLAEIDHRSREMGERFQAQLEIASRGLQGALQQSPSARPSSDCAPAAGWRIERRHLGWAMTAAVATGTTAALLVSAFWLWMSPPTLQNVLDAKAVAQWLKPEVIAALKPSKGK